jgi:hypothetical protein
MWCHIADTLAVLLVQQLIKYHGKEMHFSTATENRGVVTI